eukprot:SAG11_NODE_2981_length_2794_cov_1.858256_3_plen_164_part_00
MTVIGGATDSAPMFPSAPAADVVRSVQRDQFALVNLRTSVRKAAEVILGAIAKIVHSTTHSSCADSSGPVFVRFTKCRTCHEAGRAFVTQHAGKFISLSDSLYYSATTISGVITPPQAFDGLGEMLTVVLLPNTGTQTMGEEYCDIIQFCGRTGTFPSLSVSF